MTWESIDWKPADNETLPAGTSLLALWPMLRSAIAEQISADAMCSITVGELLVTHIDAGEAPTPLVPSRSFELLGTDRRGSWAALEPTKGDRLGGKTYTADRIQELILQGLDGALEALLGEGLGLGKLLDVPPAGTSLLALRLPFASVDGEEMAIVSTYNSEVEAELGAHITALQALAAEIPAAPAPPPPPASKPAEFKSPAIPRMTPGSTMQQPAAQPGAAAAASGPAMAIAPAMAAAAYAPNGGYAATPQQLPPPPAGVRPAQLPELTPAPNSGGQQYNIDLLLGVNLQVAVEIGRTTLPIRDVLALTPGSIVELDKLAGEKVDVLVNGRAVAQGEVVVVDENFGVRITDVVARQHRLALGGTH